MDVAGLMPGLIAGQLAGLAETLGDKGLATLGGGAVGLLFGACAQRSQFCLRAATIEFWRGTLGAKTAIWLLTFGTALLGVQMLMAFGVIDPATVRQLVTSGTLSGAVIGGALFGCGMILARGCASRLLVLSATGNMRALIAGLILTVAAQAALTGALSPLRLELASIWLIAGEDRSMVSGLPAASGLVIGALVLVGAIGLAVYRQLPVRLFSGSVGVGFAVVAGWWFTAALAAQSFDIIPVQSVSFTGPSADTLMALVNQPRLPLSFDIGLVPGVFAGSFLAAAASGEFRLQNFNDETGVVRYIAGAILMGFGGMLAGGCAVGAGVTGGSLLAVTAWVALTAMWLAAGLTDYVLDRPRSADAEMQPAR